MTTKPAEPIRLYAGGHEAGSGQMCFNEAVAFAAGEEHSAMPACASPVVRSFGMRLNDRLDDERRQLLRPFVLRAIGTAADGRDPERRQMCADWLVEQLPAILERAGLPAAAAEVREIPLGLAEANVLRVLRSVRDQAWEKRNQALAPLRKEVRESVRAELAKHDLTTISEDELAVVVAEVAAAAAAVAEAVAAAEAAEAEVAAEAVAAAAAAAAAAVAEAEVAAAEAAAVAAAAAAAAAAVAEAVAVAAAAEAEAVAAAAAPYSERWWKLRNAIYARVYNDVKAKAREIYDPGDEILTSALELFGRMLPAEPLQAPKVKDVEVLFGSLGAKAA